MKKIQFLLLNLLFIANLTVGSHDNAQKVSFDDTRSLHQIMNLSDRALNILKKGNLKYLGSEVAKRDRKALAQAQHPFATILSCSDSRVAPEIIFNQGRVGSLFVTRNAGNVVDKMTLGTLEYGVEHLKTPLIIVLGHERCGAITAAVNAILNHETPTNSHIQSIIDYINPSAKSIIEKMSPEDVANMSIKSKDDLITAISQGNIHQVMQQIIQDSPILAHAVIKKEVKIIGAYYDLDEGNLIFIE